ncbi:hypothetical protein GCM10025873_00110 [Demequina sediminis]|nr:hypothetical protein GCM10025873_00110 [Demequina sediminis]
MSAIRVGLVMGSDSDWPTMQAAGEALAEFGIGYEKDVVSAHRMPEQMIAYGREAESRGLAVIIAGAGGAAHLPGMLASVTTLPVIGVPVPLKHLDGMDSLLSIVQMPAGVPVATVSIGERATPGCWRRASWVRERATRPRGSARAWRPSRTSSARSPTRRARRSAGLDAGSLTQEVWHAKPAAASSR